LTLGGLPARHSDHAMAAWGRRGGGGEKVQKGREEEGMVAVKVRSRVDEHSSHLVSGLQMSGCGCMKATGTS
jgi:hypothetical protein